MAGASKAAEIKVEGARELRRQLKAIDKALVKEMTALHKEVGEPVAARARSTVPARTGRLGATIKAGGTQTSARIQAGGAAVPYAGVIHYGWPRQNIEPQPFLVDALTANEAQIIAQYEQAIEELISRHFTVI